jgi:hypothetical protein
MYKRAVGLALVVALTACAWPRVRCHDHGPKVSVHLDAIARLAEAKAKEPIKSRVLEAVFVCRKNCHSASCRGGDLTDGKHCGFVVTALRYSIKAASSDAGSSENWEMAERAMRHGTGEIETMGLPPPTGMDWPAHLCGDLAVQEMLAFIGITLTGPTGPKNPDGTPNAALIKKIQKEITECLAHPVSGLNLTPLQHCQKVVNAYTEASDLDPDWYYVLKELDHIP